MESIVDLINPLFNNKVNKVTLFNQSEKKKNYITAKQSKKPETYTMSKMHFLKCTHIFGLIMNINQLITSIGNSCNSI